MKKKFDGMYCQEDCDYLNLTESEQNEAEESIGIKKSHRCKLYKVQLFHIKYHPRLVRNSKCRKDDE